MSSKELEKDELGRFRKRIEWSYEKLPKTKKLIERFFLHGNRNKGEDFSPLTVEQYRYGFHYFFEWFKKEFDKVKPEDGEDYTDYLKRQEISIATIRGRLAMVKGLLRYAKDMGYLKREKNPVDLIGKKDVENKFIENVGKAILSTEEIQKLLSTTKNPRDNLIIALLYGTGMRVGELVKLNLSDVDLEKRRILIKGKGNMYRNNVLKQCLVRRFQLYLIVRAGSKDGDAPVFTSPKGKRFTYESIRLMIADMIKRAGITKHITPHSLRHTHITRSIEKGIPIPEIMKNVGHLHSATTMKYYQFADSSKTYVDRFPEF
jgi:integrase/recombinase XerD